MPLVKQCLKSVLRSCQLKRSWSTSSHLKSSRPPQIVRDPTVVSKETGDSYDGPGKTTVTITNEMTSLLMVDGYSVSGFRLNNGMKVYGPMVLFPTAIFCWKVLGAHEITEASLALFALIDPKPEMVVVGVGDGEAKADFNVIRAMKDKGINLSLLPTEHAVSTYNFLCAEERLVAGAFIPPDSVRNPLFHEALQHIDETKGKDAAFAMEKDIFFGIGPESSEEKEQRLSFEKEQAFRDRVKQGMDEGDVPAKK